MRIIFKQPKFKIMKKLLLLCTMPIIFFYSCSDNGTKQTDQVKSDTTKKSQITALSTIPDWLILDKNERAGLRRGLSRQLNIRLQDQPIFKIKIEDLKAILNEIPEPTGNDSLIFYLATYRNPADVERYNRRTGEQFTLQQLKNRPTLLVSWVHPNSLAPAVFYDICTICPPPEPCTQDNDQ